LTTQCERDRKTNEQIALLDGACANDSPLGNSANATQLEKFVNVASGVVDPFYQRWIPRRQITISFGHVCSSKPYTHHYIAERKNNDAIDNNANQKRFYLEGSSSGDLS
jgi:hypothetical protein